MIIQEKSIENSPPISSFNLCTANCLCKWLHKVFCLGIHLGPQWSDLLMLYPVFLHMRLEFFSKEWGTVITLENLGYSMCGKMQSCFDIVPFPVVKPGI